MMQKPKDKDTRHYLDLDLRTQSVIKWDYGNKYEIAKPDFENPFHHRLFISEGQYNKIVRRYHELMFESD
ncbi:MAG: hypothetical protein AAF564_12630 [Bacteroidota bacterium]